MSAPTHALDAQGGDVCAHVGAFAAVEPANGTDRRRLEIIIETIEQAMINYPPHRRFPEVEDIGWQAIRDALCGRHTAEAAVAQIQAAAFTILREYSLRAGRPPTPPQSRRQFPCTRHTCRGHPHAGAGR